MAEVSISTADRVLQVAEQPTYVESRSRYLLALELPSVTPRLEVDRVTMTEAGSILGCDASTVRRFVVTALARHGSPDSDATVSRHSVETLATEVYAWRLHLDDPSPYWVTGQRAADALGVSRARLGQLAAARRVPFVRHQDGTRLFRRAQLDRIASAGTHRSSD